MLQPEDDITYLCLSGSAIAVASYKWVSPIGIIVSHEPSWYLDGWPSEEINWLHGIAIIGSTVALVYGIVAGVKTLALFPASLENKVAVTWYVLSWFWYVTYIDYWYAIAIIAGIIAPVSWLH